MCAQRRLRSACASMLSDQSIRYSCAQWVAKNPRFLHVESEDSHPTRWMPPGWSEYSLSATVILLVLSCRRSNLFLDFDECHEQDGAFHDCSPYAWCLNTQASYMCSCRKNFSDISPDFSKRPGRICIGDLSCWLKWTGQKKLSPTCIFPICLIQKQ